MKNKLIIAVTLMCVAAIVGIAVFAIPGRLNNVAEAETTGVKEEKRALGTNVGDVAPDIELTLVDGTVFKLSEARGETVFLNFFATWCGPCVAELPDVQKLDDLALDGLKVVAINCGDDKAVVEKFLEQNGYKLTVALDGDYSVQNQYGVMGIPQTFVIDAEGVITARYLGLIEYGEMLSAVAEAGVQLGEAAPATGVDIGDVAPDFEMKLVDGTTFKLSEARGEAVFLNFFATWCGPCVSELPDVQKLSEQKIEGARVAVVNCAEDEATVAAFLSKNGYTMPVGLDPDAEICVSYEVEAIPTTYVINAEGIITGKYTGIIEFDEMSAALNDALAK